MTFVQAVNRGLSRMSNFSDRASRSEYWWYILFLVLVMYAVSVLLGFGYGLTASVNLSNHDILSQPGYWVGLAFDAFILATTLAAGARRLGASVFTGVDVTGITVRGGEIAGVSTSAGDIACDAVVCAAGAWSRGVAAMAGVDLPIEPLRRQILITEPLPDRLLPLFPESIPMTIDAASTFYFHREGPGILLGMSYVGETTGFHESYSEDWLGALTDAIEHRAPSLLDVGIAHRWSGYYEVTPDNNAVIGESSMVSRLLYAAGFSGHGFLQGPAVGEVIRDLWCGNEPVIDVNALSADRFATGATVTEHAIV